MGLDASMLLSPPASHAMELEERMRLEQQLQERATETAAARRGIQVPRY